jgi:hypothetical protein
LSNISTGSSFTENLPTFFSLMDTTIIHRRLLGTKNRWFTWWIYACLLVCWNYFFDPEDGGDKFLWNVGWNSTDYTGSYPRRWYSSPSVYVSLVISENKFHIHTKLQAKL